MSAGVRTAFWWLMALMLVVTGTFPLRVSITYLVAISVVLVVEVEVIVRGLREGKPA